MALVQDWRRVIKRAWSVRLMILAGLLSGCEAVLPLFSGAMPRGVFAGLSIAVITGALVARIIAQGGVHGDE